MEHETETTQNERSYGVTGTTCYMRIDQNDNCVTDVRYNGILLHTIDTDPITAEAFRASKARKSLVWERPSAADLNRALKLAEAEVKNSDGARQEIRKSNAAILAMNFHNRGAYERS